MFNQRPVFFFVFFFFFFLGKVFKCSPRFFIKAKAVYFQLKRIASTHLNYKEITQRKKQQQ